MKPIIASSVILLGGFAGAAMADCTTSPLVTGRTLTNAFSSKLVCGRPGPAYPGGASSPDRWQEEHLAPSGELWDYKLGASNVVDPRKQVGTWSINAAETQVTHSYTGGPSFTWDVRLAAAPNTYSFCAGSAEHVVGFIVPNGGAGCGGVYPP